MRWTDIREQGFCVTAVQNKPDLLGRELIWLDFWLDMSLYRNQVHRKAAEVAKDICFCDPIVPARRSGLPDHGLLYRFGTQA